MERCITLSRAGITVGIAPFLGGRICHFRRDGQPNCLLFDDRALERRIERDFSPAARFVTLNGHTVWLGPQRAWWQQQTLNPVRRRQRAQWPPDPWLVRGAYTVSERSATMVELVSPDSPISGVRLTKRISLGPDGALRFQVEAINCAAEPVRWGLWCNTRVSGFARCWVPLRGGEAGLRVQPGPHPVDHLIEDGCFSFVPGRPGRRSAPRSAKAFIDPARAVILAETAGGLLQIEAKRSPPSAIARPQACVEIYNGCGRSEADSLLELEWHAPYRELEPGASMRAEQRWRILDPALSTVAARRALQRG